MSYINKSDQKEFHKKWYQENHERELSKIKTRKAKIYSWYKEYKKSLKCEMCGFDGAENPTAISFHHVDKKYENVSELARVGYSKERILKEISKCIVLCENCHRKIHYDDFRDENYMVEWYHTFRKELICEKCGEKDYRCIDLHHLDQNTKILGITLMVRSRYSIEKICEEISKCKSLCANCHRKTHMPAC